MLRQKSALRCAQNHQTLFVCFIRNNIQPSVIDYETKSLSLFIYSIERVMLKNVEMHDI